MNHETLPSRRNLLKAGAGAIIGATGVKLAEKSTREISEKPEIEAEPHGVDQIPKIAYEAVSKITHFQLSGRIQGKYKSMALDEQASRCSSDSGGRKQKSQVESMMCSQSASRAPNTHPSKTPPTVEWICRKSHFLSATFPLRAGERRFRLSPPAHGVPGPGRGSCP
jgi:hypothetical protein